MVACIALAVALTGTSYAAITLPSNSVGTIQLKAGAVTSPKVRDGSLASVDLSAAARRELTGTGWEMVTASTAGDSSSPKFVSVSCSHGKRLLGGSAGAWAPALPAGIPEGVALTASHASEDHI